MSWWTSPATETQISHGDRFWLYVVAAIIMLLLIIPTLIVIKDGEVVNRQTGAGNEQQLLEFVNSSKGTI